ncbi:hypothetical protein JKL49_13675 [Phenylobacterium sp. 20VBR1]|uniref:Uncharacterized protein n=1 Tax=Phenylobacterium glaciei TaxID=2803784 RepID=A0A941D2M3_9CAUL|nr:hypothetical protein [Phenylobacterium glaciei]MBR7620437.1 hypothetical protein [Phenylobacterium glaciei]
MDRHDPELIEILIAERALDRARLTWRAREARRASGVAWSGMAPAPAEPRAEEALLAEAHAKLAARRRWRDTAQGRFVSAVSQVQGAARGLHANGERAREAATRDLHEELETCEALVRDLRRQTLALIAGVRAAQRAVRDASALTPPPSDYR